MPSSSRPQETQFREREELLDFLLEVSAITSETLDLDQLLPAVGECIRRVIPHDVLAIMLYSDKAQGLKIRYARGHRDEIVRSLVIPLGEGITGTAAASRQPLLVNDVLSDSRYLAALDAVRSELAVPMVSRGKLVGVIDIQSTRRNAFSESHAVLLRLIASRVVSSIDNARLHKRVVQANRTSRMLMNLSHEFSSILQLNELLARIARSLRKMLHYDAFSVLLVDGEQHCLRNRFSERYDQRVQLDNIPIGKGITGAAAEKRTTVRVDDTMNDPRYIVSHPDIRSEVAVPLIVQDRVVGVLDLESERIGNFTDEHVRLLSLLAPQIASSVENARLYEELALRESRMEQDLMAARRVQSILLPRDAPDIEGLEIATGWRPAREVSGDLYDFFEYGQNEAVIAFGDSSGKGAAAALYGALVGGLLRTLTPRIRTPSQLMQRLNEVLLERRVDAQYVTLLLMMWNPSNKIFTVSNAGGLLPLVCRDGERKKIIAEGVPLGLLDGREYDEVEFASQSGDTILLYSDGIADQLNPEDKDYGPSRLFRALKANCQRTPQELVHAVFADIDDYRQDTALSDDQSLIAIKVR
ncbi:MAG TPA: GAF domain-containing protein [Bryobacteraceae bacterium]|nr:GAF domain-containing protein [Bryobacteraceae bacterium]